MNTQKYWLFSSLGLFEREGLIEDLWYRPFVNKIEGVGPKSAARKVHQIKVIVIA